MTSTQPSSTRLRSATAPGCSSARANTASDRVSPSSTRTLAGTLNSRTARPPPPTLACLRATYRLGVNTPATRRTRRTGLGSLRRPWPTPRPPRSPSMPIPSDVMAVIADFAAYPEWAEQVKTRRDPRRGRRQAAPSRSGSQMDAGPIKDSYTLDYTWAPDGRSVSWTLVKGQIQKAQNGSYALRRDGRPTDGHLLARGRPEHPDDRHAAPQGREDHHRHRAQGAEAPRRGLA